MDLLGPSELLRAWAGRPGTLLIVPIRESGQVDAVVCINMIHISPWESTVGLIAGASKVVKPGGVLFLYGPYRVNGAPTTESNAKFEEWLKDRDERNGLRDIEVVTKLTEAAGFTAEAMVAMPANNFSVVFRRG